MHIYIYIRFSQSLTTISNKSTSHDLPLCVAPLLWSTICRQVPRPGSICGSRLIGNPSRIGAADGNIFKLESMVFTGVSTSNIGCSTSFLSVESNLSDSLTHVQKDHEILSGINTWHVASDLENKFSTVSDLCERTLP